jgi:hypothetical protein
MILNTIKLRSQDTDLLSKANDFSQDQNYELRGGLTSYFSALSLGDEGLLEVNGL